MPPKKPRKSKRSTIGIRGRDTSIIDYEEPAPSPAVDEEPQTFVLETMTSAAKMPDSLIEVEADVHKLQSEFSESDEDYVPAKKARRDMVTAAFKEEEEQDMVDWLQATEQECILNKKHRNYMKKSHKDALWAQKAREVGKSSEQLKKWYSNMRSRFGKLKQAPSGSGSTEHTARDRWILQHFEFIRPYMITHVKKRVTVSMKTKVQASTLGTPIVTPQSDYGSDANDDQHSDVIHADAVTSARSKPLDTTDSTETTRNDIAELQKQLLNKLSNPEKSPEKSPLQRQKDAFVDFMKEVTYTFPPPMWLKFQNEVNSLLQKHQLDLLKQPSEQTMKQPQVKVNTPCSSTPIAVSSSKPCPPVSWQPHPIQWPLQIQQPASVWGSQDANWVQQLLQQQPLVLPQSVPSTFPIDTSTQNKDMGLLTSIGSFTPQLITDQTAKTNDNEDVNMPPARSMTRF